MIDAYPRTAPAENARSLRLTPVGILCAFIAFLFVLPSNLIVGPLGASSYPAGLIGIASFFLWAIAVLRGVPVGRLWRPERIGFIALWSVSLVSYIVLQRRGVQPEQARAADRWLISLVSWTGVALVAADLLRTLDEVRRVLRALLLGASFSAAVAVAQFFAGLDIGGLLTRLPLLEQNAPIESIGSRDGFARVAGTAIHPIEFGVVCALAVAIGIHLLLHDGVTSRFQRSGLLALVAIGIPLSISRSAVLGLGVVLTALFLAANPRQRANGAIVFLVGVIAIHAVTPGLLGTLKAYLFANPNSNAVTARTNDYSMVESLVRRFPALGQGGGTDIPHTQAEFLDNQYLLTAVELGIAGVVALLIYVWMPVIIGMAIRRHATTDATRHLGLTLAACGFAIVLVSGTFDALSFPMFAGTSAILVGLAGATWRLVREGE